MPWPQNPRIIGTKVPRLDGPEKATGRARYTFDINRPGMLHGKVLRCPYARARVLRIDMTAAQKIPGFRAIHIMAKPDTLGAIAAGGITTGNPVGAVLYYAGAEVLAVACDTEEHCDDVIRAIRVDYETLPFQVKEEDGLRLRKEAGTAAPGLASNVGVGGGGAASTGFNDTAFDGLTVNEATYTIPVICHQCLESHGIVCEWDDKLENLTVWASTQSVPLTAQALAPALRIPAANVRCITHYMGGGFGSKFGTEPEHVACAILARKARAAVKLMLDRAEEVTNGGQRGSFTGRIKIGGNKQGDIRAFDAVIHGSPGTSGGLTTLMPYVYIVPNFRRRIEVIRLNTQKQRAFRAPNHPQNCFLTDQPIDDLAARLNMDPLQLRLRNLPANDPNAMKTQPRTWAAIRHTVYTQEIEIARKLSQWDKKWHPPGQGNGPIKRGIGMAMHTWGGTGNLGNQVRVTISMDGSVLVQCSTQDLGTANRTVLAIVVAEILGLQVSDITVRIGESPFGNSSPSGGSTTCPSVAPAALNVATAVRTALFAILAERFMCQPADLSIGVGTIINRADNNAAIPWRQACARIGNTPVTEMRTAAAPDTNQQGGVCGVQIAEVKVDTETGVVRCTRVVAVQDCGLIINKLACESQVAGGVIMGVNAALYEERIMDRVTGRQVNPDMEFYKLGGIQDMPDIVVHMHNMPERNVIGIGEPPMISTAAAVGNAVFNAIGRRVSSAPFTPERVLAALAQK
jgi:xanthine dehydrogenase YagR molybdenum-binding subunit